MGEKYLHCRNGYYYFWKRVPQDCVEVFGRELIRQSLKTKSKANAQKQSYRLLYLLGEIFHQVRTGQLPVENINVTVESIFDKAQITESLESDAVTPSQPSAITRISTIYNEYFKENTTAENWKPKTKIDYQSYFDTFVEIVGDINVKQLNYQLLLNYRDVLSKLPANRNKNPRFRNLSVKRILKLQNINPMSLRTINCHLSFMSSLFNWAMRYGYIDKNYATGLCYRRNVRPSDERSAYSTADLICIISNLAKIDQKARPERFWVVLIAMLTGMRLNEICQLYKNDIVNVNDIWCFDINCNDNKRTKTVSSLRTIPIHPILIKLEFLEYIQRIKSTHIWPNLPYHEKNGYGYLFQKWYQLFNRKEITQDKRKCFHSFRHSVTDSLKQNGVDQQVIAEIVGHTTGSITMERYGKSFKP